MQAMLLSMHALLKFKLGDACMAPLCMPLQVGDDVDVTARAPRLNARVHMCARVRACVCGS